MKIYDSILRIGVKVKLVDDFWMPDYDSHSKVVFNEIDKLIYVVSLCDKRRTVIQAGGHVGIFPKQLSLLFNNVVTAEPENDNYICLLTNTKKQSNITKLHFGFGQYQSTVTLGNNHANNSGAIFVESSERQGRFRVQNNVKIMSIDSLNFEDVDLIYLDTEGTEFSILLGAKITIDKYKPIIAIENKGLDPSYDENGLEGSELLRDRITSIFNYSFKERIQRDDIFVPLET